MRDQKKILIIEDDQMQSRLLVNMFHQNGSGMDVQSFENVAQTVDFVKVRPDFVPDLVITDIYLPDGDGLRLMDEIEEYIAMGPDSKVFVISSRFNKRIDELLKRVTNLEGFFQKPILNHHVRYMLSL